MGERFSEPFEEPFGYGRGWQEIQSPANPAAGAALVYQIAGQYITRPMAAGFQLVTDGTLVDRLVRVQYEDGNGQVLAAALSPYYIGPSRTAQVSFWQGAGGAAWDATEGLLTAPGATRARRLSQPANPAAGAEWGPVTVPAGQRWKIESVEFTLVTSATAGSRAAAIVYKSGGATEFARHTFNLQAASLTGLYSALAGINDGNVTSGTTITFCQGLPPNLILEPGDTIGSNTLSFAVNDQYTSVVIGYRLVDAGIPAAGATDFQIGALPDLFLAPGQLIRITAANLQAADQIQNAILTLDQFSTMEHAARGASRRRHTPFSFE